MSDGEKRVIACNYTQDTSAVSNGSRAYVIRMNPGGGNDRIVVFARSRSGRWVEKWESIKYLGNFRMKVIEPPHPRYFDEWTSYSPQSEEDLALLVTAALEKEFH